MVKSVFKRSRSLRRLQLCTAIGAAMVVALLTNAHLDAAPTTYYVATTGSDNNPGTQAAPFRTLSRGVTVLQPGDTLRVGPGTYTETLDNIPSGTSWSSTVAVWA